MASAWFVYRAVAALWVVQVCPPSLLVHGARMTIHLHEPEEGAILFDANKQRSFTSGRSGTFESYQPLRFDWTEVGRFISYFKTQCMSEGATVSIPQWQYRDQDGLPKSDLKISSVTEETYYKQTFYGHHNAWLDSGKGARALGCGSSDTHGYGVCHVIFSFEADETYYVIARISHHYIGGGWQSRQYHRVNSYFLVRGGQIQQETKPRQRMDAGKEAAEVERPYEVVDAETVPLNFQCIGPPIEQLSVPLEPLPIVQPEMVPLKPDAVVQPELIDDYFGDGIDSEDSTGSLESDEDVDVNEDSEAWTLPARNLSSANTGPSRCCCSLVDNANGASDFFATRILLKMDDEGVALAVGHHGYADGTPTSARCPKISTRAPGSQADVAADVCACTTSNFFFKAPEKCRNGGDADKGYSAVTTHSRTYRKWSEHQKEVCAELCKTPVAIVDAECIGD